MNKHILLILLVFPLISFGQKGFSEGYVITNKNDTIRGKIKDSPGGILGDSHYSKIRFIPTKGKQQKLGVHDIKEYSKAGIVKYRVIISITKEFAEVIIDGRVSLLTYTYKPLDDDDDSLNSGKISNYYLQKTSDTKVSQIREISFKKDMSLYFRDCPELKQLIDSKSLRFNDIKLIVKKYNECEN